MHPELAPPPGNPEVTDADHAAYKELVSQELTPEQLARIVTPTAVYPHESQVLALHWHPEFVPVSAIKQRIEAMFPNRTDELIIPTQHNVLTSYGDYTGVEIDCYARSFQRKVQFLCHFRNEAVTEAHTLRSMLEHTFRYRQGQLWEFMDTLLEPEFEHKLQEAARTTGADRALVDWVRSEIRKLQKLVDAHATDTPVEALRNQLIVWWLDSRRDGSNNEFVDRAGVFVKAVKEIVKRTFNLEYFYEDHEIIEEVRSVGGRIVIPHPEQFWPVLLEDYNVDGCEVWNPQSREYTDFLIRVLMRNNSKREGGPLLVTLGDDCHMGEKVRDPELQNREKAAREIGVQPWDDPTIRKALLLAGIDRQRVIDDYRSRLAG